MPQPHREITARAGCEPLPLMARSRERMVRIRYLNPQMKVLFISHHIEKRGDLKRNSSETALVSALSQAHELRVMALPSGIRAASDAAGDDVVREAAWQALSDMGRI